MVVEGKNCKLVPTSILRLCRCTSGGNTSVEHAPDEDDQSRIDVVDSAQYCADDLETDNELLLGIRNCCGQKAY